MKKWLNWLLYIVLFSLLFIAIPISYNGTKSKQKLRADFDNYIVKFNKTYKGGPTEYETRFQHFMESLDEIDRLNSLSRGADEYRARYGLTHLSDMSKAEYKDLHLSDEKLVYAPQKYGRSWSQEPVGKKKHHKELCEEGPNHIECIKERHRRAALPLQMDWRLKGVIGAVKNQGICGACWAFSTVGVIEAMAAITSGKLVPLSVQEMIDCAGLGNSGCQGGDICLLLNWLVKTNTVVENEKEYPLKLMDEVCNLKKNTTGVRVKTFTCDDFVGDETKIMEALATHGPVSVAVNALTWQNYLGGIIQFHCSGAPEELNHAVQIVGYDLTAEQPHYIVKNSWGTDFGLNGYLMLAVGSNICGLANEVASVDV